MNLARNDNSRSRVHAGVDDIAGKIASEQEADRDAISQMMQNASMDAFLLDGLTRHLDLAAAAPFVHTLKLEKLGLWIGTSAPVRMQVRLMEIAKSSLHPSYAAFRTGLTRSGGLRKAYPPSAV